MKAIRRFSVRTVLPEPIAALGDLASNLRWSWHPPTRDLFQRIDPQRWAKVRKDPVRLLSALSPAGARRPRRRRRVRRRGRGGQGRPRHVPHASRAGTRRGPSEVEGGAPEGDRLLQPRVRHHRGAAAVLRRPGHPRRRPPQDRLRPRRPDRRRRPVLQDRLLQAEPQPRRLAAGDLPRPRPRRPAAEPAARGRTAPRASSPSRCPVAASCTPTSGSAQVGRVPLLLLDSDVPDNDDAARNITNRLYGGGGEQRLQQEMLLGIGGVRALRLWSRLTGAPDPDVYHTNEGHAGFLGVERIHELTQSRRTSPSTRRSRPSAPATVFTTHTPVPAGIDRFDADLITPPLRRRPRRRGRARRPAARPRCRGLPGWPGRHVQHGRHGPAPRRSAPTASPSCTVSSAARCSTACGRASTTTRSRSPASPTASTPAPGWTAASTSSPTSTSAPTTSSATTPGTAIDDVPRDAIWADQARDARAARHGGPPPHRRASWKKRGASPAELGWVDDILDPDVLTIGFARRVPTYKRLTLMLRDPERLKRLLLDDEAADPARHRRQVPPRRRDRQAAHPADGALRRRPGDPPPHRVPPELRHRHGAVPLPGLRRLAQQPAAPVRGVRHLRHEGRPQRRLNLSILDGWWDEWFDGENGWAIPTADGVEDAERRDDIEAAALYDLIENSVAPRFYDIDAEGLPQNWLSMITHTLRSRGRGTAPSRCRSWAGRRCGGGSPGRRRSGPSAG